MSYSRNKILAGLGLESQTRSTDEVIYTDVEFNEALLDVEESLSELNEVITADNILRTDQESLENYISFMEQQLTRGGMDKHTTTSVYIGLESILSKYGFDEKFESISLEDVEEDQQASTTGVLGKTKNALKQIVGGIFSTLTKAVGGILKLFQSYDTIQAKIVAEARDLLRNINTSNNGDGTIKFGKAKQIAYRNGLLEAKELASRFQKEVKLHQNFYNTLKADEIVEYTKELMTFMDNGETPPNPMKVSKMYTSLAGITKKQGIDPDFNVSETETYLGGWKMTVASPSESFIKQVQAGRTKMVLSKIKDQRGLFGAVGHILIKSLPIVMLYDIWVGRKDMWTAWENDITKNYDGDKNGIALKIFATYFLGVIAPSVWGLHIAEAAQGMRLEGVRLSGSAMYNTVTTLNVHNDSEFVSKEITRASTDDVKTICNSIIELENITTRYKSFRHRYFGLMKDVENFHLNKLYSDSEKTNKAIGGLARSMNDLLMNLAQAQVKYTKNVLENARVLLDFAKASNGK